MMIFSKNPRKCGSATAWTRSKGPPRGAVAVGLAGGARKRAPKFDVCRRGAFVSRPRESAFPRKPGEVALPDDTREDLCLSRFLTGRAEERTNRTRRVSAHLVPTRAKRPAAMLAARRARSSARATSAGERSVTGGAERRRSPEEGGQRKVTGAVCMMILQKPAKVRECLALRAKPRVPQAGPDKVMCVASGSGLGGRRCRPC